MSLLDAARRLAAHELRDCDDLGYGFCPLCERAEGHEPDCPWLAMPKIVAALGAAEAVLWAIDEDEWRGDALPRSLREAAQDLEIAMGDGTDDDALVAALKGDVVP